MCLINKSKSKKNGFTIIELLIVIIIIAILATLAIGGYRSALRRERCKEAKSTIEIIAVAARTHEARTGSYSNKSCLQS